MTFIEDEHAKIDRTVSILSETLSELRETNNSLLETKQNAIMMTFTAITIISSFVTIVASWFLIEDPHRPFKGMRYEFWLIGLVMLLLAAVLAGIMKWRRWL